MIFTCKDCGFVFDHPYKYANHRRFEVHKTKFIGKSSNKVVSKISGKLIELDQLKRHEQAFLKKLKNCLQCKKQHTNPKFCCSSCGAKYNNKHFAKERRGPPKGYRLGIVAKTGEKAKNHTQLEKFPSSHVYYNTCAKTGIFFTYKSYRKYHPSINADKRDYYRNCSFRFWVYKYPKWFDLKIVEEYGWYSTPGSKRNGIKNLNGVSRDHMLSIHDGYVQNIDPKLMSHPANCCLILHAHNNLKNTKSKIGIKQLLQRIREFEKIYSTSEEIRTP